MLFCSIHGCCTCTSSLGDFLVPWRCISNAGFRRRQPQRGSSKVNKVSTRPPSPHEFNTRSTQGQHRRRTLRNKISIIFLVLFSTVQDRMEGRLVFQTGRRLYLEISQMIFYIGFYGADYGSQNKCGRQLSRSSPAGAWATRIGPRGAGGTHAICWRGLYGYLLEEGGP